MNERAKILMVDDRPENLLELEAILTTLDQDLVKVESGEDALRALLKDAPRPQKVGAIGTGAAILARRLEELKAGKAPAAPQDESAATRFRFRRSAMRASMSLVTLLIKSPVRASSCSVSESR